MSTINQKVGHLGVVAAGDQQTAEAGAHALRLGGNAVDAAVAAGLAAFVCEVALCGPLGGGVLVGRLPDAGDLAVDFFGRTPGLGGARPHEMEFGEASIDFGVAKQTFRVGRAAAALGLALDGLIKLQSRFGRLPLSEVAQPAVQLGRAGFEVGAPMAYILKLISSIFAYTPESEALCMKDGRLPVSGDRLFNLDLANTLEAVARRPGALSELKHHFADEFGPAKGGLITHRDISEGRIAFHDPIQVSMGSWRLSTMPAPSTGGCLIALGLRLLEDISARADFMSREHVLEMAFTQRTLLQTRTPDFDEKIHDRDFVRGLLNDSTRDRLRAAQNSSASAHPDNLLGSTTQISVIDGDGGVLGLTLTNGEGCGRVLPGTGIQVNNLLGEADINPRGFHVDPPGKHMATMMAPTIATSTSGDVVALGSGGSNRLRNAIMATLCNLIEFDVAPREAVETPRIHLESIATDYELNVEDAGAQSSLIPALKSAFHHTTVFPGTNMFFGGVHSAFKLNGTLYGVGDPRRGGQSVVVRTAD